MSPRRSPDEDHTEQATTLAPTIEAWNSAASSNFAEEAQSTKNGMNAPWSQFISAESAQRYYIVINKATNMTERLDDCPPFTTFSPTLYVLVGLTGLESRVETMTVSFKDFGLPLTILDDSYKSYRLIMDIARSYMKDDNGVRKDDIYWIHIQVQMRVG